MPPKKKKTASRSSKLFNQMLPKLLQLLLAVASLNCWHQSFAHCDMVLALIADDEWFLASDLVPITNVGLVGVVLQDTVSIHSSMKVHIVCAFGGLAYFWLHRVKLHLKHYAIIQLFWSKPWMPQSQQTLSFEKPEAKTALLLMQLWLQCSYHYLYNGTTLCLLFCDADCNVVFNVFSMKLHGCCFCNVGCTVVFNICHWIYIVVAFCNAGCNDVFNVFSVKLHCVCFGSVGCNDVFNVSQWNYIVVVLVVLVAM